MTDSNLATATAAVCEHAQLFGATPGPDEYDNRDIWDRDDATAAVAEAFRILAAGVAPDGTQLADERENFLWGIVNAFHAQTTRLERAVDRIAPEIKDLQREQDGTEIRAGELERLTERARNLNSRRDAFEALRDTAADAYKTHTGEMWRPRTGSHTSRTGKLTAAAIDARDFLRAREADKTQAHLPKGTLVAVAGGKEAQDIDAIHATLDRVKKRYADMVLVHGGGPGAEKIAALWADNRGVAQVVCKPDWDKHGRAAPFRRNDQLLNLLPKGLVAFPGNGITENLIDNARRAGIPVMRAVA